MARKREKMRGKAKRNVVKGSVVIIKRAGHPERYEEKKVYASCFFACKNARLHDKDCEKIADKVAKSITKFVRQEASKRSGRGRMGVTSTDIFNKISRELERYNKDAAFLYSTHRDLS